MQNGGGGLIGGKRTSYENNLSSYEDVLFEKFKKAQVGHWDAARRKEVHNMEIIPRGRKGTTIIA